MEEIYVLNFDKEEQCDDFIKNIDSTQKKVDIKLVMILNQI